MSKALLRARQNIARHVTFPGKDSEYATHENRLAGMSAERTEPGIRYASRDLILLAFAEVIVEG